MFAAAVIVPLSWAWACVGLVSLTASPNSQLQPGATITLTLQEFAAKAPVTIHLDTLDGPVLTTAPGPSGTMTSKFQVMVDLPSNISTGAHLLIATQTEHNMNGGNPARALIYVGTNAPAAAAPAPRAATLLAATTPSGGKLLVIAVVVGGICLFVAGAIIYGVGRRRAGDQATLASASASAE
ncbi:MAG: hypothetical protein ACRDZ8_04270 [Acidimicrobiales bacterium]